MVEQGELKHKLGLAAQRAHLREVLSQVPSLEFQGFAAAAQVRVDTVWKALVRYDRKPHTSVSVFANQEEKRDVFATLERTLGDGQILYLSVGNATGLPWAVVKIVQRPWSVDFLGRDFFALSEDQAMLLGAFTFESVTSIHVVSAAEFQEEEVKP